ncbi:MAG: hypothetical protein M3P98_01600 [bacterium]|nr:hypothetical protein [bacterium]
MAKKQKKSTDSTFFLKIVLYLILGSLWIKVTDDQSWQIPLPAGLLLGLVFASHEHFKLDRKIDYVVLLISAFVGFWLPIGLYISL